MIKIICVEEHILDGDLSSAGEAKQQAEAAYLKEAGTDFLGKLEDGDDKRPMSLDPRVTAKLALDTGAGRIAEMDKHGIDMQILSSASRIQDVPAEQQIPLARKANNRLAEAVRANPSRFGAFASLPWQHPEAAAEELERAVRELGFVGAMLLGRPDHGFLDDPRYEPVLAKLSELRVPLYLHPGYPLPQVQQPYYGGFNKEVISRLSLYAWGWHNEAGVHLLRVLLSAKFDKFPDLQVISGHWGEMVPFYLQRLDDMLPQKVTGLARSLMETFRQHVYVTPSGMLTLPHFEFTYKVLGADRLLYSVDYPYLNMAGARRFLETLPVSQGDKESFAHGNAERLFRMEAK